MPDNDYYLASPVSGTVNAGRVLMLSADNVHDLEFFYPLYRLQEEGYRVDVATPDGKAFKGKFGMPYQEVKAVKEVTADAYDLLYIPGGKAPEALRKDKDVLALVRRFAESGKPVAAICHGAQLLVSADLVRGKRIAAWPEVEKEITEAGGIFADVATATDANFITARWPGDLPQHLKTVFEVLRTSRSVPLKVAGGR